VREGLSRPLWLAVVIAAFCIPLFAGLDRKDLENDEAIYSYAVDSILWRGDWLNPVLSPFDSITFLEKPPLKFWLVAAPIGLGLVPHNELGFRIWDAFFGALAFVYVFAFGCRLVSPICGALAVFTLFVYDPLLFDHGLRGNNMEAPLLLCYCGGVYHYLRWAAADAGRSSRGHAAAVMLFFFLGFMTKFVAALFLPVVLVSATLLDRAARQKVIAEWRLWAALTAVFVAVAAPWFLYQYLRVGNGLFEVMFGEHVMQRFTTSLDPMHVKPRSYYVTTIADWLARSGLSGLAIAGSILLVVRAFVQPRLDAWLVIVWFVVPLVLISGGTSKLHHYAYPFLPPLALAVGFGPAWLVSAVRPYLDAIMQSLDRHVSGFRLPRGFLRPVILIVAVAAGVLSVATFVFGQVDVRIGGLQILRNSHIARPLVVSFVLAAFAGRAVTAARLLVPAALMMALVPMSEYESSLEEIARNRHVLRDTGACLVRVRAAERAAGRSAPGIYAVGGERWFLHSYYYYFRHAGGWESAPTGDAATISKGLFVAGEQRPMLLGDDAYRLVKQTWPEVGQVVPSLALRDVLLLMPGPYAGCATLTRPPSPSS
jgi:4-amino-4-deoxy-L-arabinose transferase-like glycosyltransferase